MKPVSSNVVIPLVKRVFPSMFQQEGQSGPMELPPVLAKQAEKWNFLSKRRLKMQLKNWGHRWQHNVVINKLICTDGKPTHFESKIHVVFEGEDITVTPVEKLMDESDTTAANQVQMAIMTGLMKGISTLSKNVPEETGKWLSQMLQQTLNPGEVTKTAP